MTVRVNMTPFSAARRTTHPMLAAMRRQIDQMLRAQDRPVRRPQNPARVMEHSEAPQIHTAPIRGPMRSSSRAGMAAVLHLVDFSVSSLRNFEAL
jgi:hypothetical protein